MGTQKADKKVFILVCLKAQPPTSDIYGSCLAVDIKEAVKKFKAIGHRFLSKSDTFTRIEWNDDPPKWFKQVNAESLEHYKGRWDKIKKSGNWCVEFIPRVD